MSSGKRSSVVAMKTVTSRPVLFLWTGVSLAVALLCSWSYSQPAWTVRASSEVASLTQQHQQQQQQHRRTERAVTIQLAADDPVVEQREDVPAKNGTAPVTTARAAIPLVHIGLFAMCIHTKTLRYPDGTVTCVSHAELDYDWLPPAWQVTRVVCGGGCLVLIACAAASVGVAFVNGAQHHRQHTVIKATAIAQLAAATLMLVGLCFYPFGLRNENLHHFCDERCQPGWASLVAGMTSAAAFLCPVIASLVANPIYDANPWEAYLLL